MAKQFLDQLVKIPKDEFSNESSCMICHGEYDTDSVDAAVRLPCNHHVGLECISTWLSQDSKNSCPMCRHVFFEVVDEEEEAQSHREIFRRVGLPPHEGHALGDSPVWQHTWYGYFVEAAAEQYQESLTRARAFVASRQARYEEFHVERQATAYRTLAVREMLLYLTFGRDGVFPPLVGPISGPLNAEQLEALFQELRRRGAFDIELHPFPHYHGLTDRQMWLLHREEGESYSTWEGGYWSLALG